MASASSTHVIAASGGFPRLTPSILSSRLATLDGASGFLGQTPDQEARVAHRKAGTSHGVIRRPSSSLSAEPPARELPRRRWRRTGVPAPIQFVRSRLDASEGTRLAGAKVDHGDRGGPQRDVGHSSATSRPESVSSATYHWVAIGATCLNLQARSPAPLTPMVLPVTSQGSHRWWRCEVGLDDLAEPPPTVKGY